MAFPLLNPKPSTVKKNILLLAFLALMVSCNAQNTDNTKNMKTERLTYFSFSHHTTMTLYNGEKHKVETMNDGRIHIVIDEGFPKEKEFFIDDTTIFDELKAIVDEFKMDKYKDNYKPKMQIFDGDSWSLYYKYDSKRSVSSGGYMAWPNNYRDARQALSDYFQKWRDYPIGAKEIDLFQYTCKNNQGRDIEYRMERGEQEATLTIRNAEYETDKQVSVRNDYLERLQELVNIYGLKDERSHSSDEDDVSNYRFLVCYNTGDTIDFTGYYTTFEGGQTSAFTSFFNHWLPVRGNLVRFEYSYRVTDFRDIKYYVTEENGAFSLSYYDDRGQRHEGRMDKEDVSRLQALVETFGLDKAKDEFQGNSTWHLFTDYDSGDLSRIGGRGDDDASKEKAQHILDALTAFFAPYLQ